MISKPQKLFFRKMSAKADRKALGLKMYDSLILTIKIFYSRYFTYVYKIFILISGIKKNMVSLHYNETIRKCIKTILISNKLKNIITGALILMICHYFTSI